MSCWYGHAPWHHGGYPCAPPYPVPYPLSYPEGHYPLPGRRARRRPVDIQDLADYLQELQEEIARVRGELEEIRESRSGR